MKCDPKLFDTLLEPTFILNSEKRILYCNEPASLLADLSVRKMTRLKPKFDELFIFQSDIPGLANLATVLDSVPYVEVSFNNDSGKSGKVQITIQPIETDAFAETTWLVYFRDVTLEETLQKKYRAELEQKEDVIRDLQVAQEKLQEYSKNLEKMVDDRTSELRKLNLMMSALLDSLGQGFFIFNQEGLCLEAYSKACEHVLETRPPGQAIWNVLRLKPEEIPGFSRWMITLFAEMLPFADLAPLGPTVYSHSQGRKIHLEYYPLRGNDNSIEGIVVVATDISDLVAAQLQAETERAHASMIINLVQNRQHTMNFLREANTLFKELSWQEHLSSKMEPGQLFQILHTLKGGASSFSIKEVADTCHDAESLLSQWKRHPDEQHLKQLLAACKNIHAAFNKFLTENATILANQSRMTERWVEIPISALKTFEETFLSQLPTAQKNFRDEFIFERAGEFFLQYNEVIKALSERLEKVVHPLTINDHDLKIFPEPYSQLMNTFIHAIRNAVDHGIEHPALRLAANKPMAGTITVDISRIENTLRIEIKDDGAGIDPKVIRQKLDKLQIPHAKLDDHEVIQFVFAAAFSTRENVTEISGRGVGMDAIATIAKKLGGKASVESVLGQGTLLLVEVPWFEKRLAELPSKQVS